MSYLKTSSCPAKIKGSQGMTLCGNFQKPRQSHRIFGGFTMIMITLGSISSFLAVEPQKPIKSEQELFVYLSVSVYVAGLTEDKAIMEARRF